MNSLRNSVQLIGNLGKDPEMTTLEKVKKSPARRSQRMNLTNQVMVIKLRKPNGTI